MTVGEQPNPDQVRLEHRSEIQQRLLTGTCVPVTRRRPVLLEHVRVRGRRRAGTGTDSAPDGRRRWRRRRGRLRVEQGPHHRRQSRACAVGSIHRVDQSLSMSGGTFHLDYTKRCQWPGVRHRRRAAGSDHLDIREDRRSVVRHRRGRLRPARPTRRSRVRRTSRAGGIYSAQWAPMTGYVPARGETVGFMVTAGSTRADSRAAGARAVRRCARLVARRRRWQLAAVPLAGVRPWISARRISGIR